MTAKDARVVILLRKSLTAYILQIAMYLMDDCGLDRRSLHEKFRSKGLESPLYNLRLVNRAFARIAARYLFRKITVSLSVDPASLGPARLSSLSKSEYRFYVQDVTINCRVEELEIADEDVKSDYCSALKDFDKNGRVEDLEPGSVRHKAQEDMTRVDHHVHDLCVSLLGTFFKLRNLSHLKFIGSNFFTATFLDNHWVHALSNQPICELLKCVPMLRLETLDIQLETATYFKHLVSPPRQSPRIPLKEQFQNLSTLTLSFLEISNDLGKFVCELVSYANPETLRFLTISGCRMDLDDLHTQHLTNLQMLVLGKKTPGYTGCPLFCPWLLASHDTLQRMFYCHRKTLSHIHLCGIEIKNRTWADVLAPLSYSGALEVFSMDRCCYFEMGLSYHLMDQSKSKQLDKIITNDPGELEALDRVQKRLESRNLTLDDTRAPCCGN